MHAPGPATRARRQANCGAAAAGPTHPCRRARTMPSHAPALARAVSPTMLNLGAADDHPRPVAHFCARIVDFYLAAIRNFVDQAQERGLKVSEPRRVLHPRARLTARHIRARLARARSCVRATVRRSVRLLARVRACARRSARQAAISAHRAAQARHRRRRCCTPSLCLPAEAALLSVLRALAASGLGRATVLARMSEMRIALPLSVAATMRWRNSVHPRKLLVSPGRAGIVGDVLARDS